MPAAAVDRPKHSPCTRVPVGREVNRNAKIYAHLALSRQTWHRAVQIGRHRKLCHISHRIQKYARAIEEKGTSDIVRVINQRTWERRMSIDFGQLWNFKNERTFGHTYNLPISTPNTYRTPSQLPSTSDQCTKPSGLFYEDADRNLKFFYFESQSAERTDV